MLPFFHKFEIVLKELILDEADTLWVLILILIVIPIVIIATVAFCIIHYINKNYRKNLELIETVTNLNRGTNSERDLILKLLKNGVPPQTIFHDLLIKKRNNKFSQADIVLATTQGIVVVEVKSYGGWIFGNGNHTNWTQVMAYGKEKYRFYNPIKQVKSQISSLKDRLDQFENIPFFSVIVFCGSCRLKEINYVPEKTYVVKPHRLGEVLNLIKDNNPHAPYTNKQEVVDVLKEAVSNGSNIDYQKQHIANIKNFVGKHRILE